MPCWKSYGLFKIQKINPHRTGRVPLSWINHQKAWEEDRRGSALWFRTMLDQVSLVDSPKKIYCR